MFGRRRASATARGPDPEAFLAALRKTHGLADYTARDRRRDFRRVFAGSADGRRVLYQILLWGGLYDPSGEVPLEPQALQRWAGRRDLAAEILTALNAELAPDDPEHAL